MGMRDWKAERDERRNLNNFLLDFENYALSTWYALSFVAFPHIPQGPTRVDNPAWSAHIQTELVDSGTTWEIYSAWVRNGGGDDCFFEE